MFHDKTDARDFGRALSVRGSDDVRRFYLIYALVKTTASQLLLSLLQTRVLSSTPAVGGGGIRGKRLSFGRVSAGLR